MNKKMKRQKSILPGAVGVRVIKTKQWQNEAAFKKDNGEFMTYYDIINQIATLYGVQFFQSYKYNENQGGCWWIFSRYVMYNE